MVKIIDGMFDDHFVQEMYQYVKSLPFDQHEVDVKETHLSQGTSQEFEFDHPLIIKMIKAYSEHLTNSELQRTYCNKILNTDTPQSHRDSKYEVDMTVLYYVNPNYDFEWGGETIFYNDECDAIQCVTPKTGRVVIFPGNVLHSARPFAMYVTEPRYTIAFKYVFSF